jgi:hypothetical protein
MPGEKETPSVSAGVIESIKFLRWCEARHNRLNQIAEVAMRAPETAEREELFLTILAELGRCTEMVARVNDWAHERRVPGRALHHFTVPVDMAAIDALDAALQLRALALSPVAGVA